MNTIKFGEPLIAKTPHISIEVKIKEAMEIITINLGNIEHFF